MKHCKFGLIGHPIAHSLSPALFKAGYDGRYPYDLIEGDDFEESYRRFIEGYDGINVTAPFKELAYAKADIVSEDCRLIKATNLLVKTTEGVKAYNSDLLGVRMWLKEILNHPSIASSDARPGRVFANANTERQKGSPAERSEDGMPLGAGGEADWGSDYSCRFYIRKAPDVIDIRGSDVKVAATYSPTWWGSTIGDGELNFSVRNGKRWILTAITATVCF